MGDQATATTTPHPLYFSSFDDALSTEPCLQVGVNGDWRRDAELNYQN
jgi:hypothetical protein